MKALFAAVTTALISIAFSAPAATLVSFGDSLTDGGNAQAATLAGGGTWPSTVYPAGQFTNGDTWATQLGLTPSLLGGTNFAFGGARAVENGDAIPDFLSQIGSYSGSGIDADIATVWFGGNDFLALSPSASLTDVIDTINNVVGTIALGVQTLALSGIDEILVFGLPDLGLAPINASDPVAAATASLVTDLYNSVLQSTLGFLNAALPTSIGYFDTNSLFLEVIATVPPHLASVPCIADPAGCAANPLDYVFYDDIHPTEWVHTLLAQAVTDKLGLQSPSQVPLPATAPLLLACLGGFALLTRRRRSPA